MSPEEERDLRDAAQKLAKLLIEGDRLESPGDVVGGVLPLAFVEAALSPRGLTTARDSEGWRIVVVKGGTN